MNDDANLNYAKSKVALHINASRIAKKQVCILCPNKFATTKLQRSVFLNALKFYLTRVVSFTRDAFRKIKHIILLYPESQRNSQHFSNVLHIFLSSLFGFI